MGKSEKRLLGWEPTERHEYEYDDAGRVSSVVVTRDPEWDDDSRDDMLALAQYEAGICECGFHRSLTHDKANHFTWDEDVCPVCAGAAQYARWRTAQDKTAEEALGDNPAPLARRPDDGRTIFTKMSSTHEVAAKAAQADPAQQREG